jgi:aspartyl/asparaginyl beta-hydroxylase (cupin superfamily)
MSSRSNAAGEARPYVKGHSPLERAGLYIRNKLDRAYYHASGGQKRPVFFDVDRTWPALRAIDRNYDVIREELLAVLPRRESIPLYHVLDRKQQPISDATPGSWRTLFVSVYGAGDRVPTRHLCPRTVEIVESIPNMLYAFFSILDAGKKVPAHNGPNYFYLRYHTAFVVPRQKPPQIRVKDQYYTWRERESVLFDDSWNHEVLNESEDIRVVLITDIIRPRPIVLGWLVRFAHALIFASVGKHYWDKYLERMVVR